jgi:uncharacterized repeat protein (TIGR03806 family)
MGIRALGLTGLAVALFGCGDGDPRAGLNTLLPGLDERPGNATCIAPARVEARTRVSVPRVFPDLTFASPVALAQAPGDASRWFAVERGGRIRVFDDNPGVAATRDFVDLSGKVHGAGEAGLLGFALHPDFASNGLAYVNYVGLLDGTVRSITSEFASPDGGLTLDPGSERVLLLAGKGPSHRFGGNIEFGPDGFLYIGLGDGGEPGGDGGDPRSLLGKMLRIDVDARPGGAPYGIPGGANRNPFFGNPYCGADGNGSRECPEIFAPGLQDPRRWSFDRRTGALWLGDAGLHTSERISRIERGGSKPVAQYGPTLGFSITGGRVYRGRQATRLAGRYVFGDRGGMIATLAPGADGLYTVVPLVQPGETPPGSTGPLQVSAFGEGADGELYVIDEARGQVRKLVFTDEANGDNVPQFLSETGCANMSEPGAPPLLSLIPFAPNAVLWSDGARKDRWLGLPDTQNVTVPSSGKWEFPSGTVLVKHFRLGERLMETRLFMRHPDGVWAGYTYHWNEAQTEAVRVAGGLTVPVDGQDYIIPSEADCLWCHNEAAGFSLGPETAQLNGAHLYPQTGRLSNQIVTLNAIEVLTPPVGAHPPAYAVHTDTQESLDARARAYLHINCSICHRPGGPTPAMMDLRHDTPLPATEACDVVPTLGDLGIPDARIIAPGDSARSELLSRMSRRDAFGMPPLASNLADTEGVALIRAWIDSLTAASCR